MTSPVISSSETIVFNQSVKKPSCNTRTVLQRITVLHNSNMHFSLVSHNRTATIWSPLKWQNKRSSTLKRKNCQLKAGNNFKMMLFLCNKYSNFSLDLSIKQMLLLAWLATSLKESVHLEQDLYLLTTISALGGKDGRIHHVQKMLPYIYITIAGVFAPKALFVFLFLYFSVSMFFSFAMFFSRISTPSASFIFLILTLEAGLNMRLMRLRIIRQKETFFFTIWLLCLYFIFGKDVPWTPCSNS